MLTTEQVQAFARDGFLRIDPKLDVTVIDAVVQSIGHELLGSSYSWQVQGRQSGRAGSGRVQNAWKFNEGVRSIAHAPAVLDALTTLFQRKPRPFQTLNFRLGTQQKAHSDTVHFNSHPRGFMCGVWTALEDVDEDNGAVFYYPGSHQLPEFNLQHVFSDPDTRLKRPTAMEGPVRATLRRLAARPPKHDMAGAYACYEAFMEREIAKRNLKPVLATVRKGQSFIWAANLLHGGSLQKNPLRTRHSQVTHYFFEGCQYHRPLLDADGKMRFTQPEWVQGR